MSHARTSALMLALAALGACSTAPEDAVPMAARAEYAAWWAETVACAGPFARDTVLARVTWRVVPDIWQRGDGRWVAGHTDGHRITLAAPYAENATVVRHEMLHVITGRGDHPAVPFDEPCHVMWTREA